MNNRGKNIHSVSGLVAANLTTKENIEYLSEVDRSFSIKITDQMVNLIDPTNIRDPIGMQFLPSLDELNVLAEEMGDPIGDEEHSPVKGIIHRYPDRLLLKPHSVCSVHCRFCFRRGKRGSGYEVLTPDEIDAALEYVRSRTEIWEVILSGGDPLMLSEDRLIHILTTLDQIDHVEVLRIHTRVPITYSEKITSSLIQSLKLRIPVYIVIHCNHPKELTPSVKEACSKIVDAGIPMLCQTVLLKGINDNANVISDLMRNLVRLRIKPYYLHHGDLAQGTSHFRNTISEGQSIMEELRGRLSGICQPTYVLDIPGGYGKVPIGPSYLHKEDDGEHYIVRDPNAKSHIYPPKIDKGMS